MTGLRRREELVEIALLRLFCEEVATQCKYLVRASEGLSSAISQSDKPPPFLTQKVGSEAEFVAGVEAHRVRLAEYGQRRREANDRLWLNAHVFVVTAANISKLLWGSDSKRATEREALRKLLQVTDEFAFQDRKVRHHFEHLDERLEKWHTASKNRPAQIFIDHVVGPVAEIVDPSPAPKEVFRHYDPETGQLTFWGDAVSVLQLTRDAGRLLSIAQAEVDRLELMD
jgi:hypothetical protein